MKNKKFAILNSNNTEMINTIKAHFEDICSVVENDDNLEIYDLIVLLDGQSEFYVPDNTYVINFHPSLLPAFQCSEAVKEAFLNGVKVSGVTVHRVEKDNFYGQIIAQYPVLIGLETHIDEFEKEIIEVEKKLAIPVIDTILNDRVFDFHDLFRNSCSHNGGCGGNCSNCNH